MKTLPEQIAGMLIDLLAERLNHDRVELDEVPIEICSLVNAANPRQFLWTIKVSPKTGDPYSQNIFFYKEFYLPFKPDEVKACAKLYFLECCKDRSKKFMGDEEFDDFIRYLVWIKEELGN